MVLVACVSLLFFLYFLGRRKDSCAPEEVFPRPAARRHRGRHPLLPRNSKHDNNNTQNRRDTMIHHEQRTPQPPLGLGFPSPE